MGNLPFSTNFTSSSATVHLHSGPVGRADVRHVSNRGQCGFAEHTLGSEKLSSAQSRKDTRKQSLSILLLLLQLQVPLGEVRGGLTINF